MMMHLISRGLPLLFVLHPLADEGRAGNNAEFTILSVDEKQQRRAIQFLQMRQVEQGP